MKACATEPRGRRRPCVRRAAVRLAVLLLAAAGGAPAVATADVVVTTDGKTLEGKVISQDDAKVVIETTFDGTKEVPRASVKSVDTKVPPLREQLAYRLGEAGKDVKALEALAAWAKSKGFGKDVEVVWIKVLEADPKHVRAHKALGHVLEGGKWMTPEEKAAHDAAAAEAAQRAKGLVPHEGRWVTPEEKAALEKGLMRDGDEWVTEDEWHLRRGETKVDGRWVRVGEAEGKARAAALSKALSATLEPIWSPHVDVFHELRPEDARLVVEGAEKGWSAFASLVRPGEGDGLRGVRVQVFLFEKAPLYARHAEHFGKEVDSDSKAPGWSKSVQRQGGWWWVQDVPSTSHYLFPNTPKALVSRVVHYLVHDWLTLFRFNRRFPSLWLLEGLSYAVELRAHGYSQSFVVGKGGGAGTDPAVWQDAAKWKDSLRALVAASQDTPANRLIAVPHHSTAFTLPDLVKSWSLVEFLVQKDRSKWKAFLDATKVRASGSDPERTDEDALREVYGMDARALEAAWRAWVQAGFPAS